MHLLAMHLPQPLPLLDLERLEHLSRELDRAAAELLGLRSALRFRAAGLRWHSGAARACQAVLLDLLGQLGRSGARLADLAAMTRAHGRRAAGRVGAVARLAHSTLDTLDRVVRRP